MLGRVVRGRRAPARVIAAEVGATELALAAISAYVTYRMLRYGIDLKQALTETIELERPAEIP